jgi:hypothetical protein
MIIACPITNDAGHATDGWILMMNDRARHLLRFDGTIGNLRLTQLPQFAGVDLWGRLYAPKSAAAATPVTTADFDVEIMRFPHVFGLRISPKAARLDADAATLVPGMGAGQPVRLISRDRFACAFLPGRRGARICQQTEPGRTAARSQATFGMSGGRSPAAAFSQATSFRKPPRVP